MTYSLQVNNLNKTLSGFSLEDISFNIPSGSIVGLIGENGSGKTTTIKNLLNIMKKDSGDVIFWDKSFDNNEIAIKEELGVVMDEIFFPNNFTPVMINKVLNTTYKNWDEEKFFSYLEKFKLPKNKIFKEYSKGMQMKLSISSALSHKAKMIILDEPTSGLDPIIRSEILDEFLDFIQDEQCSILFSTHITSDLDRIADYIIFIHEGKIVFSKDREELLTDYGVVHTRAEELDKIPKNLILRIMRNDFSVSVLVKNRYELSEQFIVDSTTTENIMLFFIKGEIL